MNINRIEAISPLLFEITKKNIAVEKKQDHLRVEKVEEKDSNMKRYPEHDPKYFYDLMKDQNHLNIKDVSDKHK